MAFFDLTVLGAPVASRVLELPVALELWAGLVGMLAASGAGIVACALGSRRVDRGPAVAGVPELRLVAPRAGG